jgi:hypothetical protein
MATDAQIAANQTNALKSTGPRTMEGKMKSRRNALKHGMASDGKVLPPEDRRKFNERITLWSGEWKPQCDMERYQLEIAVSASVQVDRCKRHEEAEIGRRRRVATQNWEKTQKRRIKKCTKHWLTQPAECLEQLQEFTRGCEWILAGWEELAQALEDNECLTAEEGCRAMRLLGWPPELYHEWNGEVAAFRTFVLAANPEVDCDEVDLFFGVDTSSLELEERKAACRAKLPSIDFGREALWSTMDAEFERLVPLREALWEADGPALSEKIDLATFDDSPTGILRRRYQTASHLDMSRSLKRLAELRRVKLVRLEPKPVLPKLPFQRELTQQERERRGARPKEIQQMTAEIQQAVKARNEANLASATAGAITTSGESADAPQTVKTAVASDPNRPGAAIGGIGATAEAYEAALRARDEMKKNS